MKVYLVDRNIELVTAWNKYTLAKISELHTGFSINALIGNPLDQEVDAIVSPANSFGFMDGGIDYLYTQRFGTHLQERLQKACQDRGRELLVGEAYLMNTGDTKIRFCISAPTMRTPRIISDPIDVFLATRAAIDVARKTDVTSIVIPGMGTGVGKVPYYLAAPAMINGINAAFKGFEVPRTWQEACDNHDNLKG